MELHPLVQQWINLQDAEEALEREFETNVAAQARIAKARLGVQRELAKLGSAAYYIDDTSVLQVNKFSNGDCVVGVQRLVRGKK